ncbi:hypothetical protein ACIRPQ_25225 [Streptomyces sp. NPDC101213]|uniref:hypothetical protein n=1 Tax=Streptomyces sp. NPDC101213 TaxID=3366130 RepID=UPI003823E2BF
MIRELLGVPAVGRKAFTTRWPQLYEDRAGSSRGAPARLTAYPRLLRPRRDRVTA